MKTLIDRPRSLGLCAAAAAVGLGLAYMAAAGAPERYLIVNAFAFVLGATAWLALGPAARSPLPQSGAAIMALASALLATALLGLPIDGASRWVFLGPLTVQVSLLVVPAMIVLFARRPDGAGTIGMAIAALALALQPDRGMAGVLAAGLGAVAFAGRSRLGALAFLAAMAGFAAAMIRPDALPAVPFVDRILYTAFDVDPAAGAAVVAGCLLLLLPVLAARAGSEERAVAAVFGACWAAVVAAAAIGNYPTPLVGYGGSAVLGYLLSVALLPSGTARSGMAAAGALDGASGRGADAGGVELRGLA
jgi:cell division protein FtsW (lipid II flippase)